MRRWNLLLLAIFLLPTIVLLPTRGSALYNYSASEGTRCSTCHINPTGGMLRTQVGVDYAQNDHSFQQSEESGPGLSFFLGENLQAGSDVRFLYTYNDSVSPPFPGYQSRSTFFTMQGALYLSANLGRNLVLFFNNDFGFRGFGQNRELWGMIRRLPYQGYVKIGRFRLPYGMRLDDHTAFIKDSLGFGVNTQDNGIEIGFTPSLFFAHLAVTNGKNPNDPFAPFDQNTHKAITASAGAMCNLFSLGWSFYYNRGSFPDMSTKRAGAFGSISLGNLQLLGEVDYGWDRSLSLAGDTVTEVLALYTEAGYRIHRDIWLKGKFDFFDPMRGTKDDDFQRVTLGGDVFLFEFSEVKLQYRINLEEPKVKNNEILGMYHVFF